MSDHETILREFIAAWHEGSRPDPGEFLAGVPNAESEESLARELTVFLELAGEQPSSHSEDQLETMRALPEVLAAAAAYGRTAAGSELSRARESHGLSLAELARKLLRRVGMDTTPERTKRAAQHLEGLESGRMPRGRVTSRAANALRDLLDVDLPSESQPAMVFFRQDDVDRRESFDVLLDAIEAPVTSDPEAEVDRLFFGGEEPTE